MSSWCACWTCLADPTTRSVTRTGTVSRMSPLFIRPASPGGSPAVSDSELSELAWFRPGELSGLGLSRFARALLSATGHL